MAAKAIKSLREKKYRQNTKKFLVEGEKCVVELLKSDYEIEALYATAEFKKAQAELIAARKISAHVVEAPELAAYGTLEHNDGALAVARQKEWPLPKGDEGIVLALDEIRDPGNLGTIIRIADWYGVRDIICSPSCVDWHSPKVIMATMGSFARVRGHYAELPAWLAKQGAPVLGTFLDGASAHEFAFPKSGVLVIGSESHGISKAVAKAVTQKVTIPSFGGAESLNAAVAAGIVLDRWKGGLR